MKTLLIIAILPSCTIHPSIRNGKASLGSSFLTRSEYDSAGLTLPDGSSMQYTTQAKDETGVAINAVRVIGATAATKIVTP